MALGVAAFEVTADDDVCDAVLGVEEVTVELVELGADVLLDVAELDVLVGTELEAEAEAEVVKLWTDEALLLSSPPHAVMVRRRVVPATPARRVRTSVS